jgi:hypothetical protein
VAAERGVVERRVTGDVFDQKIFPGEQRGREPVKRSVFSGGVQRRGAGGIGLDELCGSQRCGSIGWKELVAQGGVEIVDRHSEGG